tara:strand:- start:79 stop:924 length:846 start_codon:yes stop_codon:yes gene_type:complete
MNKKVAVAYIPVLHKGYLDFLEQLTGEAITQLYLIGDEILQKHEELDYINRKDRLRAVSLSDMKSAIVAVTELEVFELTPDTEVAAETIVTPREDIGEVVAQHYFADREIDYRNVFIRRNNHNLGEDKVPMPHESVAVDAFGKTVWTEVLHEAEKSADWYRRVGAALVKDGKVVYVTHNEHMPEQQLPNIEGDARTLFKKGIHINYVTAAHAEVAAIGAAAKAGIVTDGAELFVTDFPCPYCARLIAKAGIKKVYYLRGYAVLDGDDFLREEDVEVIKVQM